MRNSAHHVYALLRGHTRTLVFTLLLVACVGSKPSDASDAGGGTLVIATTADPHILFPPLVATNQARQVAESIYDYLVVVGPDMNTFGDAGFRPRLAESWKWSPDSLSIAFRIHPKARWHDGVRADASDVRFTFQVYMAAQLGSPTAEELSDIDSVTTADSLTALFWYHARSPHQLLDASQMMILPRHLLEKIPLDSLKEAGPSANPVGTGRFRFHSWTRESSVEITADTANYRGRPGLDRVIWTIAPNFETAVTKLLGGEADLFPSMRYENVAEIPRHPELRLQSFSGTAYAFLAFNLRDPAKLTRLNPLFASRELRRALTMAVDRVSLVRNTFDTLAHVALGPTVRSFPTTDTTLRQIPFDPNRAAAILDSLGWTQTSAQGIRRRGGRELAFRALVASSSQSRMRIAVLMQEQLRRIGVRMKIEKLESNTLRSRMETRDFEAALWDWQLGATPNSLRETWGGKSARSRDGINFGAYESPVFDAYVDSATSAIKLPEARHYFTRAYQVIIDDAPAIWLDEPKTVIGINRRIRIGTVRPDSWWYDLGGWFVPKTERIARDRISGRH